MRAGKDKDYSIMWTIFLMKLVGLWMAADKAEQRRRKFAFLYTMASTAFSICITIRGAYHTWGDLAESVYNVCNVLYPLIILYKVGILYIYREDFFVLVKYMQKHFWHLNYDNEEKKMLANCRMICTTFGILLAVCIQGCCTGYMIPPILLNIGKNESDRILPFNLWVDLPLAMTPYFEAMFTVQMLCMYHIGACYICFDNFICIANIHVATQFRILQYRLVKLNDLIKNDAGDQQSDTKPSSCSDVCRNELKRCIQLHQVITEFCRSLEDVFTVVMFGQIYFLTLVMCLVGYQLLLMDTPSVKKISLVFSLSGVVLALFMLTYTCDGLMYQSLIVSKSAISTPWTSLPMDDAGRIVRQSVLIIIMRSGRACCLTAGGFFAVSLETFTTVLSTAMSCFTLLRESSVDKTET